MVQVVWRTAIAAGLIALAVWQVSRSDKLSTAQAAERAGDPVAALRLAFDHLDRHPGDQAASLVIARGLTKLEFYDRAEPYYAGARQAGLLTFQDLQARALGLTRANQVEKAEAAYEEILRLRPDDPDGLRRLATVHYSQARWREARKLADRLAQLPGQAVIAYTMIASIEHEQRHPDRAVAAGEKVLALDPELRQVPLPAPIFWTNLAQDLLANGQPAKARRYLSQVLAQRQDAVQMDLLGQAYQWESSFDDAERCYRQAAEWDPKLFQPWLHLGRLMMQPQHNQPEQAIRYLKRAAELAPQSFEPPYSLSLVYRRLRQPEEAARYQKQYEELHRLHGPPPSGMGADASSPPMP